MENLDINEATLKNFTELMSKFIETYKRKNSDYGNAVDITYLMFGDIALLVRLWDKVLRLTQLQISGISLIKEEAYEDTLQDLAIYSAIGLTQKKTFNSGEFDLGKAFNDFITLARQKKETEKCLHQQSYD